MLIVTEVLSFFFSIFEKADIIKYCSVFIIELVLELLTLCKQWIILLVIKWLWFLVQYSYWYYAFYLFPLTLFQTTCPLPDLYVMCFFNLFKMFDCFKCVFFYWWLLPWNKQIELFMIFLTPFDCISYTI